MSGIRDKRMDEKLEPVPSDYYRKAAVNLSNTSMRVDDPDGLPVVLDMLGITARLTGVEETFPKEV